MRASGLTLLNLEQPTIPAMRADYESNAPTGVSLTDIVTMEQFLIGVRTHSGQNVTPEKARRCATVLAIMRGISEDISSLPLRLFKHTDQGDVEVTDHPVHRILNVAPNNLMTPLELREHMIFDLMLQGNFYNLINADPDDPTKLGSVWPLQAAYVTRRWRESVWVFTDPLTGEVGNFTPDTVWRGTVMSANGIDGMAITLLAREAIGLLLAAEEQAARLFSQGVQTDLSLSTDGELDADSKEQLRKAFMARHAGASNAWMPMIFEGGLKANRLGLTAQESQYIESRGFQIGDVARAFRYPEVLLGSLGKSSKGATYASAEQFFMSYTKHCLLPWAIRIEQTGQRDLLTQKEQAKFFLKHDFDQLLRADMNARYDAYNKAISGGWMQPAEPRRKENLPYKPGLEYFNKSLNTAAIGGSPEPAPTDISGAMPDRIAHLILRKEQKVLVGRKEDPDKFYPFFSAHVEELTGATAARVGVYLEGRRTHIDRFSTEAQAAAIADLISLCKG